MQVKQKLRDAHEWSREARLYDKMLPAAFLLGILLYLGYFLLVGAPANFPTGTLLKIPKGETVAETAQLLKSQHIIRSTTVFEGLLRLRYGTGVQVVSGEYFFPGPENLIAVARRFANGKFELVPVRVTVPEGASTHEMAAEFAQKIPVFDQDDFLKKSASKEGYLFPDTYFFLPGESPDEVIAAMQTNFTNQLSAPDVQKQIVAFGKPLSEIITMASILEKEAPDTKNRRLIAGLLWKRISIGMPLQVDAVFPYIIGVNSLQLTKSDLKTDSPYNTYLNKGLPPGPIASPSLDAILAAVNPTKSNYLFYLSDLHGVMHYCATYACQLANQKKYLGS